MEEIISIAVGVLCIVLGILLTRGHLSLLHSYHRKRVSEEDRLPFGRLSGAGIITVGAAIAIMGVCTFFEKQFQNNVYSSIGTAVLIVGTVVGLGLAFYAMIKYNKGIF